MYSARHSLFIEHSALTKNAALSPFLTWRTFVREHSWEYSANVVGS